MSKLTHNSHNYIQKPTPQAVESPLKIIHTNNMKTRKNIKSYKSKSKKKYPKSQNDGHPYIGMPPPYEVALVRKIKRRYESVSSTTSTISLRDLWCMHLTAVSAVTCYTPWRACRILRVQVWCPVAVQGQASEISLTPVADGSAQNSFADLPVTYTDSTISVDRPAYIDFRPHKWEVSGSWHLSNSTVDSLITILPQTGSVLDITMEVIDNLTTGVLGFTETVIGATIGNQYCRAIGAFVPVGINTI
jgi:hypothetical protein